MKMIALTTLNKEVVVPCHIANQVKRLINKFHFEVTDILLGPAWFYDSEEPHDWYELTIYVMPTKKLRTRKYRNTRNRLFKRFVRQSIYVLIMEE